MKVRGLNCKTMQREGTTKKFLTAWLNYNYDLLAYRKKASHLMLDLINVKYTLEGNG